MARASPRIKTDIPARIKISDMETGGRIVNISLDSAYIIETQSILNKKPGSSMLISYELEPLKCFEQWGRIIRAEKTGFAVILEDMDIQARLIHWNYIIRNLINIKSCPYCGKEYIRIPEVCETCNWQLNFEDPDYFNYYERKRLIARIQQGISNLDVDNLYRIYNFLRTDILKSTHTEGIQEFVGTSSSMLEVFSNIRKIAPTDLPVLILGETGTGKELTALAIHERSPRKNKPFLTINCAAIPETLLEAELFCYERGAFTGAFTTKKGKFELADGGTVFLDEIGDLPVSLQAKLLRFLEDGVVERIGGKGGKKVNVRIIAATNSDLEKAIKEGRFRSDLYFRLNAFTIKLPPLRERGEDKIVLANYFFKKFTKTEPPRIKGFSEGAINAIMNYSWPGNVRELINKIRRAIVIAKGELITPSDLELDDYISVNNDYVSTENTPLKGIISKIQKEQTIRALIQSNFNISRASKALGISRQGLYGLLKRYAIDISYLKATNQTDNVNTPSKTSTPENK